MDIFKDHTINVGPPNGATETRLDFKTGPQALPDPSLGNDGQTNFSFSGEKEMLGQGAQSSDEGIKDDEYPTNVPDQAKTPEGNFDVSLDAVAPYKYPEYPMQSGITGLKNAGPP